MPPQANGALHGFGEDPISSPIDQGFDDGRGGFDGGRGAGGGSFDDGRATLSCPKSCLVNGNSCPLYDHFIIDQFGRFVQQLLYGYILI